ncbi:MAG TPA: protein kinase [Gemmatimonadales bacterium]|nr:protein kinase [Gemmatimonadales bacterium]
MAAAQARLAQALADRYRIEHELGQGGMATVYLAHDLKHDRPVALKVLRPELAASLGSERFEREIRLAARLQHPHLLSVHDSGEAAGHLWFTMPYVDGESLRDRLLRQRQLGIEDALRITREAAQALQYAHDHDVIHRDIKPENLLLTTDGATLVADFGIARALRADERLTDAGLSVGTPAYMSPEQASGDESVDPRTDIYSLGCVLYEMLAGEPPFTGPTAQAIMARRLTERAPSVRRLRPTVPESVNQALERALAPLPADRYGTVAEFSRALAAHPQSAFRAWYGPLLVAGGLGALLLVGVFIARHRDRGGASGPRILAVLPFDNLGDSADAYFADGIANEVRGKLSQIPGLAVIARASSNEYRHTRKTPQQVAHELGADYLLTGTVEWERSPNGPSRVRVSPELEDVTAGAAPRTKWSQAFDASLTDVFQVQADIATKVTNALDVALGDSARRELVVRPTASLSAYDAFLKGEAASGGMAVSDPPDLRRAIGYYEQAVALDSAFVPAWAQLARARALLYANSKPTPELAAESRDAAERARRFGPDRAEGQLALGDYFRNVSVDHVRALSAYEAGLKLAPNDAELLGAAALSEWSTGRWEAALGHLAKASRLDPRSTLTARRVAWMLLCLRQYSAARTAMDRTLALAPASVTILDEDAMLDLAQGDLAGAQALVRNALHTMEPVEVLAEFGNAYDLYWVLDDAQQQRLLSLPPSAFDNDRATWAIVLAQTYALRGRQTPARAYADSARLAFETDLRVSPEDGERHVFLGLALALLGQNSRAIAEGARAIQLFPISRDTYYGAYIQHQVVRIYLLAGEPEKALDLLEPLLKMPYYLSPGWLRIDPNFAPLRGNPRFQRLVAGS